MLSSAISSCAPAAGHRRSTAIAGHDSRLRAVGAVPSHSKFVGVQRRIHHVSKSAIRAALTADAPSAKPDTDFLSYKTELLVILYNSLSCANSSSSVTYLGVLTITLAYFGPSFLPLHSHGCHGSWGKILGRLTTVADSISAMSVKI